MASESTNVICTHTPLCEACEALHDVDQEILDTISALQRLNLRRQEMVTNLNRSHDRVIRIPPEITSHVFYLYAHSSGTISVKDLFTIALVSKSWCNIVLSTPPLWTSIALDVYGRKWVFPYEIAEAWLKRSGSLQVNITLRWRFKAAMNGSNPRYNQAKIDKQFLQLLRLLQKHRGRMQHLHFQIPVDILHKFEFDLGPIQMFSLSLSNAITSSTNLQIPSGMKQLTCLRIDAGLSAGNVADLLRQCPLLVEWTGLVVRHQFGDAGVALLPVESIHLSIFEVDLDEAFPMFLFGLTMPSLRRFTLKLNFYMWITPTITGLSVLPDLISRSPGLCDFSFQCTTPLDRNQFEALLATLHHTTQLHSLSLTLNADHDDGWDPTSVLLQPFLALKPGPPFLPHLRHFYCSLPRLRSWIPIASFYKYHSTAAAVRSLSVADFSSYGDHFPKGFAITGGGDLLSRGFIDSESLEVFLTLPTTGLSFKFNLKLLAVSIEHHGLPTPGEDTLSYYTGLKTYLETIQTFRRRILGRLNRDRSSNDTL